MMAATMPRLQPMSERQDSASERRKRGRLLLIGRLLGCDVVEAEHGLLQIGLFDDQIGDVESRSRLDEGVNLALDGGGQTGTLSVRHRKVADAWHRGDGFVYDLSRSIRHPQSHAADRGEPQ